MQIYAKHVGTLHVLWYRTTNFIVRIRKHSENDFLPLHFYALPTSHLLEKSPDAVMRKRGVYTVNRKIVGFLANTKRQVWQKKAVKILTSNFICSSPADYVTEQSSWLWLL